MEKTDTPSYILNELKKILFERYRNLNQNKNINKIFQILSMIDNLNNNDVVELITNIYNIVINRYHNNDNKRSLILDEIFKIGKLYNIQLSTIRQRFGERFQQRYLQGNAAENRKLLEQQQPLS